MKKFIAAMLIFSALAPYNVLAEEITLNPPQIYNNEINPLLISDAVGVDIYIEDCQVRKDSSAHFNLFNSKGELVGTDEKWIDSDTDMVHLQFNVPQYEIGEVFTLGLVDGLSTLTYYSYTIHPGNTIELGTYAATDDGGNIIHGNNFALSAIPNFERVINLYYNGELKELPQYCKIIDGIGMAPAQAFGDAIGMAAQYFEEYNSFTLSIGEQQLIYNIDTSYATLFGTDTELSHAPLFIDDTLYIPIRDTLTALGCTIETWEGYDHIDVIAPMSPIIQEYRNRERVNQEGITSRTDYLIWVSKSDFTVKVYKGSRYNWECIKTAPCAIGAPGTPTIEGQFEYQYPGGYWDYGSYYVYPTMMFYGGYALHSTLRATGGGVWDDRVGVMISHGCVRLHPNDIEWIYKLIPIGTRIYVTP